MIVYISAYVAFCMYIDNVLPTKHGAFTQCCFIADPLLRTGPALNQHCFDDAP